MEVRSESATSANSSEDSSTPTLAYNELNNSENKIQFSEEDQTKIHQRGFKKIVTNRTPQDFFFIKVLGEGSFSTVSQF